MDKWIIEIKLSEKGEIKKNLFQKVKKAKTIQLK